MERVSDRLNLMRQETGGEATDRFVARWALAEDHDGGTSDRREQAEAEEARLPNDLIYIGVYLRQTERETSRFETKTPLHFVFIYRRYMVIRNP